MDCFWRFHSLASTIGVLGSLLWYFTQGITWGELIFPCNLLPQFELYLVCDGFRCDALISSMWLWRSSRFSTLSQHTNLKIAKLKSMYSSCAYGFVRSPEQILASRNHPTAPHHRNTTENCFGNQRDSSRESIKTGQFACKQRSSTWKHLVSTPPFR
jgi:hypothetical protein